MKKYRIIFILSIITFVVFSCTPKENNIENIENRSIIHFSYILNDSLSLDDYSTVEGYMPQKGLIPTAEMAIQIAEIILKNIYGNEKIEGQKPFSVNIENDIWIIEGHLEKGYLGGVVYIELSKKNGEVLKVIHTK